MDQLRVLLYVLVVVGLITSAIFRRNWLNCVDKLNTCNQS